MNINQSKLWAGWAAKLFAATLVFCSAQASAQADIKVGLVNSERVLRESTVAKAAEQRLEAEFIKRDKEIQDLGTRLKSLSDKLEKDNAVLPETERNRRQRELQEIDRDLQRKQREYREDLNQRRNEEFASIQERAQRIIKQIAEAEKYDLIVQEAIYFSNRIDITDKVIKQLNAAR